MQGKIINKKYSGIFKMSQIYFQRFKENKNIKYNLKYM